MPSETGGFLPVNVFEISRRKTSVARSVSTLVATNVNGVEAKLAASDSSACDTPDDGMPARIIMDRINGTWCVLTSVDGAKKIFHDFPLVFKNLATAFDQLTPGYSRVVEPRRRRNCRHTRREERPGETSAIAPLRQGQRSRQQD